MKKIGARDDIDGFMHAIAEGNTAGRTKTAKKRGLARVRGGKGTASRTVGLLGAIFTYPVRHRMRADTPFMASCASLMESVSGA